MGAASTEAARRFSPFQWRILGGLGAGLAILLAVNPIMTAKLLFGLNAALAGGFLILRLAAMAASYTDDIHCPPLEVEGTGAPTIALLCPLYNEPQSVKNLITAIGQLDYPREKLDVLLLLEVDDHLTEKGAGTLPSFVRIVRIPSGGPRTKPNALSIGLSETRAEIVGIYDAEDRPEKDQLLKVAQAFREGPADLGCVQARLNYYNRDDSFITRLFALEYSLHFDWFLSGLARLGLPLPLGGTSNFVLRSALEDAGGWDPYNVTEDADLGIRLSRCGYRIGTVDSTTYEEATDTARRWVKQRSRWLKGYLQTWIVHMRSIIGWREAIVLHFALGAVFMNAVVNPLMWCLFLAWIVLRLEIFSPLFEGALGTLCLFLFVAGNAAHIWCLLVAPLRRGWYELTEAMIGIPYYWFLQSAAGYKALLEFVFAPHYWDKTDHSEGEDVLKATRHA
ncbi:glycosyltransferase family 2 protein [Parvularcula lutaonensis]|uniref:Glycosyltransferase family 2 protein n=1 Tax=Parvularcula lutaonensis TaxID=491923 RepID=A0ABV7MB60_9PROT|nr:glycosyltransferase family 2 protein [Parvularcula lutaonensis]